MIRARKVENRKVWITAYHIIPPIIPKPVDIN